MKSLNAYIQTIFRITPSLNNKLQRNKPTHYELILYGILEQEFKVLMLQAQRKMQPKYLSLDNHLTRCGQCTKKV